MNPTVVYVFLLLLSIVLIVLGSIVMSGANKCSSDQSNKDNIKKSGTGILVIGILFLLVSAGMLYKSHGHALKSAVMSGSSGSYYF